MEPEGDALHDLASQFVTRPGLTPPEIGGLGGAALREEAREAALEIGRRFARRFGLWEGPAARPRRFVVTGHQPVFAHPGILAKNVVVAQLAAELGDAVALNLVVDYDTAADLSAAVPFRQAGRLTQGPVRLAAVGYGTPFCHVPAPDRRRWESFCLEVDERLATLGAEGEPLRERTARFAEQARDARLWDARHLAEWMSALRHRWEAEALGSRARYLEVPLEELAETRAFRVFFAHVALQAERFASVYNETLARYRRLRRIRSRANPFPDLAVEGSRVEVPFWLLTPGVRRRALHVEREGQEVVLSTADGPAARLPAGSPEQLAAALERSRLSIRPRAAALTMFVRLFLADVFVHGIGGARYDRVTDALIAHFFEVEPPRYAVASASLALDLRTRCGPAPVAELRRRLRDLRFNPQRFVLDSRAEWAGSADVQRWAQEKQMLVCSMNRAGAPRRELTRRIEQVNAALYQALAPLRERLEAHLQEALAADAERRVREFRGYPAFLYDPEALRRMAETALRKVRRPLAGSA